MVITVVTSSTWLLQGLRGYYGVSVQLLFFSLAKIALLGSDYGTALRVGVIAAQAHSDRPN